MLFIDVSNVLDISSENEPLDVQIFVKKHMEKRYLCLNYPHEKYWKELIVFKLTAVRLVVDF